MGARTPQLRGLLGNGAVLGGWRGARRCGGAGAWVGPGLGCRCDSQAHRRCDGTWDGWEPVRTADATVQCLGGTRSRLQVRPTDIQVGVGPDCSCGDTVYGLDVVRITTTQYTGATWSRLPVQHDMVQVAGVTVWCAGGM